LGGKGEKGPKGRQWFWSCGRKNSGTPSISAIRCILHSIRQEGRFQNGRGVVISRKKPRKHRRSKEKCSAEIGRHEKVRKNLGIRTGGVQREGEKSSGTLSESATDGRG